MAGRMTSPTFVGRDDELARLAEAFAAVQDGEPGLVVVGGDAGMGKTRLLGELTHRFDNALVLTGGCVELGEGTLPYAPLVEVLRELARSRGDDGIRHLLTGPRRELRRLLPDGSAAATRTDPADLYGPSGLLESVLSLLEVLAQDTPVVLVLEDLHWASRSTLDLVAFLGRNLAHGPVLVVATFRTDELHRRHPLRPVLAELARLPAVDRLDLPPLTDDQVAEQVTAILGHPPHEAVLRQVIDRSEGNAFYVEELLAASSSASGPLPPTLRDILADRLAALPADAMEVLRIAAAAGRRVDHELLERVAHLGPGPLRDGLRTAIEHEILLTPPGSRHYRFRHALLQEAVYDDLLPGERTRLHAEFAHALEADPALAVDGADSAHGEIAFHAHAARQLDRAYVASLRAARQAQHVLAFGEEQHHLERTLDLWPNVAEEVRTAGPSRLRLMRDAASAARFSGDHRRGIAHLRTALATEGPDATHAQRAALLGEFSSMLWAGGETDEALAVSLDAIEADPAPSAERAGALAWRAHLLMLLGRSDEAIEPGRAALALARELDAPEEVARAQLALGSALGSIGEADESEHLLRSCLALATEHGWTPWVIRAHTNLGATLLRGTSRFDVVRASAREGLRYAEAQGWTGTLRDFLRLNLVSDLSRVGRLDEADHELSHVVRRLEPAVTVTAHAQTAARLRLLQGRYDVAAELLDRSRAIIHDVRDQPQFGIPLAEVEATLALVHDRLDEAASILDTARALGASREGGPDGYEPIAPLVARVAAERVTRAGSRPERQQQVRRAGRLLDELRADLEAGLAAEPDDGHWARQLRTAIAQLDAERTRVDATPDPDAWAAAEVGVVRQERVPEVAYLRLRRAEALVGTDRRDEATALLRDVHADAIDRGMGWISDQAEALAQRARIALPGVAGATTPDPFGLTPRERDVLALVAEGLTNPQIGERLFIAAKTASVHLSNLMPKLGASTRQEAADIARRHGLDDPDGGGAAGGGDGPDGGDGPTADRPGSGG